MGTGVDFALLVTAGFTTGGLATNRPGLFGSSDEVDLVAFWVSVGGAGLAGRGAPGFGDVLLDVSGLAPEAIVEGLGGDAVLSPLFSAETVPFFGTPLFDVDCSGMLRLPHMDSTMPDTRRADHLRFPVYDANDVRWSNNMSKQGFSRFLTVMTDPRNSAGDVLVKANDPLP
ncbi:hypothetical protein [Paeniglutamicibacter terrestris]|uniref:Uncharacterized protein n=1 Tax=Paeniglutamicibacter terrestris TaxID=2723403 RepID=A0ABX1G334_9MICC|nr:hypothetical protein [Paeniglutamicibacter terrestris]